MPRSDCLHKLANVSSSHAIESTRIHFNFRYSFSDTVSISIQIYSALHDDDQAIVFGMIAPAGGGFRARNSSLTCCESKPRSTMYKTGEGERREKERRDKERREKERRAFKVTHSTPSWPLIYSINLRRSR